MLREREKKGMEERRGERKRIYSPL